MGLPFFIGVGFQKIERAIDSEKQSSKPASFLHTLHLTDGIDLFQNRRRWMFVFKGIFQFFHFLTWTPQL